MCFEKKNTHVIPIIFITDTAFDDQDNSTQSSQKWGSYNFYKCPMFLFCSVKPPPPPVSRCFRSFLAISIWWLAQCDLINSNSNRSKHQKQAPFWNRMKPTTLLWNQQTMGSNCARTIDVAHWTTETRVAYDNPTYILYSAHARWSYHKRLGSLFLCVCSMCDVNCLSAITSHRLLIHAPFTFQTCTCQHWQQLYIPLNLSTYRVDRFSGWMSGFSFWAFWFAFQISYIYIYVCKPSIHLHFQKLFHIL